MVKELGLSERELQRVEVLSQFAAGTMRRARVAELLGVSPRQVKRLTSAFRQEGAAGLRSKRRGRPSNRRLPGALRSQVLELVRTRYVGFGPTLCAEYLLDEHGIQLAAETLRLWCIAEGLWQADRKQRRAVHPPRARRPRFGELTQIDGSPHAWLEDRGPRCTLIVFIDDASSYVVYARLVPVETTAAYFAGVLAQVTAHGKPLAYYSDRHSIFRVNKDSAEAAETQFERALKALDIELICALSPQAKGRVERVHQTFQDRLVKALRLADARTLEQANQVLENHLPKHNARFAIAPAHAEDAHRPNTRSPTEIDRVLSPQHHRTISKNGTVQWRRLGHPLFRGGDSDGRRPGHPLFRDGDPDTHFSEKS